MSAGRTGDSRPVAKAVRADEFVIGVISDTHGVLPDAAESALAGVDAIVHAGDVGGGLVLDLLAQIAPVTIVRGNCDTGADSRTWPDVVNVRLGGVRLVAAHRGAHLRGDLDPVRARARVAVSGHTHVGRIEQRDGVVWVNPGSPTQPRGGSPASVALVHVGADGCLDARLVPLP